MVESAESFFMTALLEYLNLAYIQVWVYRIAFLVYMNQALPQYYCET